MPKPTRAHLARENEEMRDAMQTAVLLLDEVVTMHRDFAERVDAFMARAAQLNPAVDHKGEA